MQRAGWLSTTLLILGGVTLADDQQVPIVTVIDRLERSRAASKATNLTPGQVQRVLQRATGLKQRGHLDDAVSLLQRALLLTDAPEPRIELANAHHQRARLYETFAETAKAAAKPKRAAGYTAHAQKEAAAATRLQAHARQLTFDQADADDDGRISEAEGAALLQRLGGRRSPQVRFAGLSDTGVTILSAAAAATTQTRDALVVTGLTEKRRHTDSLDLEVPVGKARRAALKRAVEAQLRRRGLSLGTAPGQYQVVIEASPPHLHIGPTRP